MNDRTENRRTERRDFVRRRTALPCIISKTQDFKESWPVTVESISVNGMYLIGDLPDFGDTRTYVRFDGTDSCITCDPVTQNLNGIRLKIDLDPIDLGKLIGESDIFASLVLEVVPSDHSQT